MDTVDDLHDLLHLDLYRRTEEVPADVVHGAHYRGCQDDGRDIVISRCGIALDPDGDVGTPDDLAQACPDCNRVVLCPVCGTPLVSVWTAMSWRHDA